MDKLITRIKEIMENGESVKIAMIGPTGSGKSMASNSICENVSEKFGIKNVVFSNTWEAFKGEAYNIDDVGLYREFDSETFENLDNNLVMVPIHSIKDDDIKQFDYIIEMGSRNFKDGVTLGSVYEISIIDGVGTDDEIIKTEVMNCEFRKCSEKLQNAYELKLSDVLRQLRIEAEHSLINCRI